MPFSTTPIFRLVVLIGLALAPNGAEAADYRFTQIVNNRTTRYIFHGLSDFGQPINNNGTVAFYSRLSGSGEGIFTGDGNTVETIADRDGPFNQFSTYAPPSLNNTGQVAYYGKKDDGSFGIYVSDGNSVLTIADTNAGFNQFGTFNFGPMINDQGTVAFFAVPLGGVAAIYTSDGSSLQKVIDTTTLAGGLTGYPSINNAGAVAYTGRLTLNGVQGIFVSSGGTTQTLVDTNGPLDRIYGIISINDSGQVAYSANYDEGGDALFVTDATTTTLVADSTGAFNDITVPAINEKGEVAFLATLDGSDDLVGIFTGSDPVADKVIQTGDSLFGSIVTELEFYHGLNDRGQIAFEYRLENNGRGIAVATLVPEPASLLLGIWWGGLLLRRGQRHRSLSA